VLCPPRGSVMHRCHPMRVARRHVCPEVDRLLHLVSLPAAGSIQALVGPLPMMGCSAWPRRHPSAFATLRCSPPPLKRRKSLHSTCLSAPSLLPVLLAPSSPVDDQQQNGGSVLLQRLPSVTSTSPPLSSDSREEDAAATNKQKPPKHHKHPPRVQRTVLSAFLASTQPRLSDASNKLDEFLRCREEDGDEDGRVDSFIGLAAAVHVGRRYKPGPACP